MVEIGRHGSEVLRAKGLVEVCQTKRGLREYGQGFVLQRLLDGLLACS